MRFVFDCGLDGPTYPWGPRDCEAGLGGSEECVIYLSEALVRRGHEVIVINNIPVECVVNGVSYHKPEGTKGGIADVYISWRAWQRAAHPSIKANRNWLWCHDIPVGVHFPNRDKRGQHDLFSVCDSVILLNQHHRAAYNEVPDNKVWICPIGIVKEQFSTKKPIPRIPGRVIYSSHPNRGLHELRRMWPAIKKAVPFASLSAYWWEPSLHLEPVRQLDILPMQSLGHAALATAMMESEILGYPSIFHAEISPATCIKAQAAGAIPVVVLAGGMKDVCPFGIHTTHESFTADIVGMLLDTDKQEEIRSPMRQWALENYSWDNVASLWEEKAKA